MKCSYRHILAFNLPRGEKMYNKIQVVQPAQLPDEKDSDHMDINVTGFGVFINKNERL